MTEPIVIAHRGASGYRPEHTLAAYRLAIALGADYVEPDLVPTRDGVLVARHESELSGSTDVARRPELAHRMGTKVVGGREVTGWFTEDLTLAELKMLRAVEPMPATRSANTRYDGCFEVPTLEEILDLVEEESARLGRRIGLCPEIKRPSYFAGVGLGLDERLLAHWPDATCRCSSSPSSPATSGSCGPGPPCPSCSWWARGAGWTW